MENKNVIEFNGEKYFLQGEKWEEEYTYGKRILQIATQGENESLKIYHVYWLHSNMKTPEKIVELKKGIR